MRILLLFLLLLAPPALAAPADILIVGAGTAGCPLAARLCQALPHRRITLLERAAPRTPLAEFQVRAPRTVFSAFNSDEMLERFDSLVSPTLNRSHQIITGATLGGTSTVSGLQWSVPLNGSVDSWHIHGLTSETAAPYFQRAYEQLSVSPPAQPLLYAQEYVDAAVRAGFELSTNHLDSLPRAVWQNRLTIDHRLRRTDACSAYVQPLLTGACAHNLRLEQNITATRLILCRRRSALRAVGVVALHTAADNSTTTRRFLARNEVILSAGPYGSAKLLQLSGIGPSDVLSAANVPQRLELPVGTNTVCRASIGISSVYNGVPNEPANNYSLVNDPEQREKWERGEYSVLGTPVSAANGRVDTAGYFGSNFVPYWPDVPEVYSYCHTNVQSRGFMRIRDDDPMSPPLVQNNLLGSDADLRNIKQCVNELVSIHKQFPPRFNMSFTDPDDGVITHEWIRRKLNSGAHFVGACPVGQVLDEKLHVKGVQALRVVDSSVMRHLPVSAGPMASVVMIAEYMADMISNLYRQ